MEIEMFCPICDRWGLPKPEAGRKLCRLCREELAGGGRVLVRERLREREKHAGMLPTGTEVIVRRPKRDCRGPLWWDGESMRRYDGLRTRVAGVPWLSEKNDYAYYGAVCYLECSPHLLFQWRWLEVVS